MRTLLFLTVFLCSIFSFAQKKKQTQPFVRSLPVPHQSVNDFSKFLTVSEKQWLEKELVDYRVRTRNAIVFISLDSLTDPKTKKQYTIEEAALLYFNKWGIGDSIKNNGVLLMASRQPRRVRIQVGTGLEAVLTNDICQAIIDEKLVPNFKQGLFFTGIKEAVHAIENKLDNLATATQPVVPIPYKLNDISDNRKMDEPSAAQGFGIMALILLFALGVFKFARYQARRFGGWFTGGGYRRTPYHGSYNNYNNNNYYSGGGYSGGWSSGGGSSSSSSSSSGSSGGGSYGGGSSSGGGASGSW
jgi:uncharacterized protein